MKAKKSNTMSKQFQGTLSLSHVIFNLHVGVGHTVLCQMEGEGSCIFQPPHFQMLWPTPLLWSSLLFDQSLMAACTVRLP